MIHSTEHAMLRLKKLYEIAVEDRNYTAIQLIDRNDELCILYEKANIQERILRRGDISYREREEDIRLLRLDQRELQSAVVLAKRSEPMLVKLQSEIVKVQVDLVEARERARQMCVILESPECHERWKAKEGKDPSPDELAKRIRKLEEQLNQRHEQLLEKGLILDEVVSMAEAVRKRALARREESVHVAAKVNECRAKIRSVSRRLLGGVAELTMYKSHAAKAEQERRYLEQETALAKERLERGEAPTVDAATLVQRWERERDAKQVRERMREAGVIDAEDDDDDDPSVVKSTAVVRPTAYMPDGLALPKPYGVNAPFYPSAPGGNLRHFRKPVEKPVEI